MEAPSLIEFPCAQCRASIQQNTVPAPFPLCLDSPLGLCFNLLLCTLRCPAGTVLEHNSITASAKGDAGFAVSWSRPAWNTSVVLLLCTCNMKTWEYAVISSPVAIRITQQPPENTDIFKSSSSYRIYIYITVQTIHWTIKN